MYAPVDRDLLASEVPSPVMRLSCWIGFLVVTWLLIALSLSAWRWNEERQPTAFDLERTEIVRGYWQSDPGLQLWGDTISDVTVRDMRIIVFTNLAPDEYDAAMAIYETFWRYVLVSPDLELGKVVVLDNDGRFLTGGSA